MRQRFKRAVAIKIFKRVVSKVVVRNPIMADFTNPFSVMYGKGL